MEVYIGADYRGFDAKTALKEHLVQGGHAVEDMGATEKVEGDDFNDPAIRVAKEVRESPGARGVLICDSAHGVTMQANRYTGVRAANCDSVEAAKLAREHDNANVVCLSAHFIGAGQMKEIVDAFLATDFVPLERRMRRINRLDEEGA